jgi:Eukaryotic-type carbonic anhydrase
MIAFSKNKSINFLSEFSILAFFYQIKENLSHGDEIDAFVRHLSELDGETDSVTLPYTFSLHSLIENINTDRFYTYRGSVL